MLYSSNATSPSRGCPFIHSPWLAKMRSPSATSSGPTVHMMTRCDFPMCDMLTHFTNRVGWPSSVDSLRLRPSVGWCGGTAAEAASHAEPRPRSFGWASVRECHPSAWHLPILGEARVPGAQTVDAEDEWQTLARLDAGSLTRSMRTTSASGI